MRIVAGDWGGRTLRAPRVGVRPTQDRVRQILFDILGETIREGPVLDLYSGTGALGLEALSRGAPFVVFVERGRAALCALEGNREALGARERSRVLGVTVERALELLSREQARFRWILADPPYEGDAGPATIEALGRDGHLFAAAGGVVLEARDRTNVPEQSGVLERRRVRTVGETALHFYAARAREAAP